LPRARTAGAWDAYLLSANGVLAAWVAYGVLNSLIRIGFGRTLSLDDARASELVQTLSSGYQLRNPPLYEWLLWGSERIFGAGVESHLVLRFSLVAALGLATCGAARRVIGDQRWAAIASLSMLATYAVGWRFHDWATQTILLSIACVVTFDAALFHLERPSWRSAALLGAAAGFGLMAKFSYPLFLAGLLLALASMPETRRKLADRRLLLVPVLAAVFVVPYAIWLLSVDANGVTVVSESVGASGHPSLPRALIALGSMLWSLPAVALQWVVLVAAVTVPFSRWRVTIASPGVGEQVALRAMILAALLATAGAVLIGASDIGERHMYPILAIAPIYLFARAARYGMDRTWIPRFAAVVLAALFIVPALRVATMSVPLLSRGGQFGTLLPFEPLTAALAQRGIVDGTVVTPDIKVGGNLRSFNPNLRIVSQESYRLVPVPRRVSDDRSCVLVWSANDARGLALAGTLRRERLDVQSAPSWIRGPVAAVWWVARLDPRSKLCG
jgi:hypothetical protein